MPPSPDSLPGELDVLPGDVLIVFDNDEWKDAGHDQPEGNGRFYHPATILRTYRSKWGDPVADVRFHHDGRESRGHLIDAMSKP